MDHIIRASPRPRTFISRLQQCHLDRSSRLRFSSAPFPVLSSARPLRTTSLSRTPTAAATTTTTTTTNFFYHARNVLSSHPINSTTRRLASSMTDSASTTEPQLAEGVDAEALRPRLAALLQPEQGWTLDAEARGLQKTYYFKTYFKAVSFVNVIASQSAAMKHHPTMTVRIGSVDIHWTTHQPRGLTAKDVDMAQHCDEAADLMGAVEAGQGRKCH
ncbi:4a-hydroxytetrahydrobiopterin dehydratase [Aspergillus homomorphus CBS 101889]|uniref:4a-hydroxytetrahydrobiopterin dehydratase n=1 Tax=Aspergillus homomorphus (strain CBS 101889) TaxID=1450537 RepID=A0A395IHR6_ASPHC|nr:transcriptional coactivator/pterin dehydratase [Aspergillus homomorphus CBS 101889]RAL17764.1 transcriptional coactivator/pterin dehydratase [Aspergillus homomorphus CBS 101889]